MPSEKDPEKARTQDKDKLGAIRNGLLEFVVLNVISAQKVYAADILAMLAPTEFLTQEGTLYPLLSKLRRESLLDYSWKESDTGPPRKYYSLTDKGKDRLSDLKKYWEEITKTIKNLAK